MTAMIATTLGQSSAVPNKDSLPCSRPLCRFGFDIGEADMPMLATSILAAAEADPNIDTSAEWHSPSAIPTRMQTTPTRSRRESDQAVQRLEAHVDAGESRRMEGWLMKQTASKGNSTLHKRAWRRRYFILQVRRGDGSWIG